VGVIFAGVPRVVLEAVAARSEIGLWLLRHPHASSGLLRANACGWRAVAGVHRELYSRQVCQNICSLRRQRSWRWLGKPYPLGRCCSLAELLALGAEEGVATTKIFSATHARASSARHRCSEYTVSTLTQLWGWQLLQPRWLLVVRRSICLGRLVLLSSRGEARAQQQ
jgi:hypothetical protein